MVSSIHVEPVSRSDQYKRVMKPLLERKRRARINKCLDELRDLLVSVLQAEGEAVTRLEKADILELTVRHVRKLSQRRRLALPTPSVKLQQEREEVAKFQQGFVAAAQQVQSFLMSTNSLEPAVSSRLISHLSNYATSMTPSPTPVMDTTQSPASSPVHPQQPPPGSSPPQMMVARPPPIHPTAPSQTAMTQCPPPVSAARSPAIYSPPTSSPPTGILQNRPLVTANNTNVMNHQPITAKTITPPYHPSTKLSPPPPPSSAMAPPRHSPPPQSYYTSSGPIIRDVKPQDRLVAPSPFIDVVSTDNEPPAHILNKLVKSEPPSFSPPLSSADHMQNIKLRLQAKVVASIALSQQAQQAINRPGSFIYTQSPPASSVPKKERHVSSSNPQRPQSPMPEDLSMKRYDNDSSWRPW